MTPDESHIKAAIIGFYINGAKPELIACKMGIELEKVEEIISQYVKVNGEPTTKR